MRNPLLLVKGHQTRDNIVVLRALKPYCFVGEHQTFTRTCYLVLRIEASSVLILGTMWFARIPVFINKCVKTQNTTVHLLWETRYALYPERSCFKALCNHGFSARRAWKCVRAVWISKETRYHISSYIFRIITKGRVAVLERCVL
jgi:hypothetical protein